MRRYFAVDNIYFLIHFKRRCQQSLSSAHSVRTIVSIGLSWSFVDIPAATVTTKLDCHFVTFFVFQNATFPSPNVKSQRMETCRSWINAAITTQPQLNQQQATPKADETVFSYRVLDVALKTFGYRLSSNIFKPKRGRTVTMGCGVIGG